MANDGVIVNNGLLNGIRNFGWLIGLLMGIGITLGVRVNDVDFCKNGLVELKQEVRGEYVRKDVFDLYQKQQLRETGEIKDALGKMNTKLDKLISQRKQ